MKLFICGLMTCILTCSCTVISCNSTAVSTFGLVSASSAEARFAACIQNIPDLASLVYFPCDNDFKSLAGDFWNTAWTLTRKPAAVARPTAPEHVSQLVVCANAAADLKFTVKGGGHSYEAMSLINNGLVLDLGKMDWMVLSSPSKRMISNPKNATSGNSGSTSPATPTLLVGPGARMGPIYTYLYKHGLMLEGSTCPTVGVSGLAQGKEVAVQGTAPGGWGFFQIISCQVVTTSGVILNVSASSYPDLFWALRGGGANYAIVTQWEFETAAYPYKVSYGALEWPASANNLAKLLQAFNRWKPWLLPEDVARLHVAMYWDKVMLEVYCWCSDQQLQAILASFPYNSTGLTAPSKTVTTSWNFSQYMLSSSVTNCYGAEQWSWQNISTTQAVSAAEQDWRAKHTHGIWPFKGGSAVFMDIIPDTLLANFSKLAMQRISNPKSFTRAVMIAAGGLQRRLSDDAAGFGYRRMTQQLEIGTEAHGDVEATQQWVDAVLGALMPASKGQRFYNHFQCLPATEDPWKSYFGAHADRLRAVKAKYDPQGRINAMYCNALNK